MKATAPSLIFALTFTLLFAAAGIPVSFSAGCGSPQFGVRLTNVAVGIGPRSIAVSDVNEDGKNDLAVANYGSGIGSPDGGISILLNNGAGGFSTLPPIAAGINPRAIGAADFNNDGHPDLAVLNYVSGSCCISSFVTILLGNGSGSFTAAGSPLPVGNDASALASGDFNSDGKTDLAATINNSGGGVAILLGDGAGGFSAPTNFNIPGNLTSIATSDVNGDLKIDLLVGNLFGFSVAVLLGDGAGGFAAPLNANTGAFVRFVAVGDFNQDSKPDLATATTTDKVAVLLGNGDGSFGASTLLPVAQSPQSVFVVDVNVDGRPDLVTASSFTSTVSVVINNGGGSFGAPTNYVVGSGAYVTGGELNGDGNPDLAVANISSNDVSVLTGDGTGAFGAARTFDVGLQASALASGDFNGDGKTDLVVTNNGQNSVSVLLGSGSANFGAETKYPTNFNPADVTVADLNGDGNLDLAVANGTCCQIVESVSILLGTGTGAFSAPTSFSAGTDALAIISADFNKDGNIDLATVNNADKSVSVLFGNGNGTFTAPTNYNLPTFPTDIAAADLDGDGNTDLVIASGSVFVLRGNSGGGFSVGGPLVVPGAIAVAVGDVNRDGKADVVTANSTGSLSILIGDGLGNLGAPTNFPVSTPVDVTLADFNNDGKVDLAASTTSPNVSILLGDGTGLFGAVTTFAMGNSPRGILAKDLSGDGRLDLAAANSVGYVAVLVNSCSLAPTTPDLTLSDATVIEGNTGQVNASFTAAISSVSANAVTVSYYTVSQTAVSGVDYQAVSGHITFAPGTTSQTINVPILGDLNFEPDEVFFVQLRDPLNANITRSKASGTIQNDDAEQNFLFSASSYSVNEDAGHLDVTVTRSGDTSAAASVDYKTTDTDTFTAGCSETVTNLGGAFGRCDFATSVDTLTFASGIASQTFSVPIINDSFAEGNETFSVVLSNASGATLGTPSTAVVTINDNETVTGPNPILTTPFFVRQHYLDFLSREPEAGEPWTAVLNNCSDVNNNPLCDRLTVSSAFFGSPEFQLKGYFVYRFYKLAFNRLPLYTEIVADMHAVTGQTQAEVFQRKATFSNGFAQRTAFITAFGGMTNDQYVLALMGRYGLTQVTTPAPAAPDGTTKVTLTIADLTTQLTGGTLTRAQVLRAIADSDQVFSAEFNQAFVAMQYYGYLRRTPEAAGFNAWLAYLSANPTDSRTMVNGFMNSAEYRLRFGPQ